MMHSINYITFDYKTSKQDIMKYLNKVAFDPHESSGYHGNIRFHENTVYDNEDKAREAIQNMDNGWYDDHAVLFNYRKPNNAPNKKINELREKYVAEMERLKKFTAEHDISQFKSNYISCPNCGSKINKKYIGNSYCPACRKDMRSESVKKAEANIKAKMKDLTDKIQAEIDKQTAKEKPTLMWLVKYEYHC